METEFCYLDLPATLGSSAIYHFKPQFYPSLDFSCSLMPMDYFGSVPIQQIEFPWIALTTGTKPKFITHLWTLYFGPQEVLLVKSPNSWGIFSFLGNCFSSTLKHIMLLKSQLCLAPLCVPIYNSVGTHKFSVVFSTVAVEEHSFKCLFVRLICVILILYLGNHIDLQR